MAFLGRLEAFLTVPVGVTVAATNGGGGPTTVTVPAGSYTATGLAAAFQAALNTSRPSGWTVSISTSATGTGKVSISCSSTFSITWTSTDLRDALGFTANIVSAATTQTAANCARGLWMPDAPLTLDGDTARAPIVSDLRTTVSPTGYTYGLSGTRFYRHKNLRWSHVPKARVWEVEAIAAGTPRNSWETWFLQTQIGGVAAWLSAASRFELYDHNGTELGADYAVSGWFVGGGLAAIEPRRSGNSDWVGLWEIAIPEVVSNG